MGCGVLTKRAEHVNSGAHKELTIRPVAEDGVAGALRLLFRRLASDQADPYVESTLRGIGSGSVSAEGLLEARRGDDRVGVVWVQIQPGRTALVWPPQLATDEPPSTAEQLLRAAERLLASHHVRSATALVIPPSADEDTILRCAGFEPLADLIYLFSHESSFPDSEPETPLDFEPFEPAEEPRLIRLVDQTYVNTLDCPALNGLRSTDDVLAGYRATGVFSPDRWLFVRHQGHDVGCLLMADHPEADNLELVYMGLIPSARGKGWGKHVCRHAQWIARRSARPNLVLAVDAANWPALEMYASVGFRAFDRRRAYVKRLGQ